MCIRDRPITVDIGTNHLVGDSFEDAERVVNEILAGKKKICLLYTSDAADERSSVDLGGRRIIKKKIHVQVST